MIVSYRITRLSIPADLAVLVCRQKCFREVQIFLWMKCRFSDRCILSESVLKEAGQELKINQKTIRRSIKALLSRNWIGYNGLTKTIYPRSFETIRRLEEIQSRKAFHFHIKERVYTKAFLIATAISIYLNRKEYFLRRRSRINRGRHLGVRQFKQSIPTPVAICNKELAKYLNISISTASAWKSLAVKSGFMNRIRTWEEIPEKPVITSKKTAAMIEETDARLKGRIRAIGNKLMIQGSDRMTSLIIRCKRKGQNPIYNKGYRGNEKQ